MEQPTVEELLEQLARERAEKERILLASRAEQALNMVWYAFPAAELTACAVAVALTLHIYRARMARFSQN